MPRGRKPGSAVVVQYRKYSPMPASRNVNQLPRIAQLVGGGRWGSCSHNTGVKTCATGIE